MSLTKVEKEQIQDSKLKIEAVSQVLSKVDPDKINNSAGIQECLEDASKNLGEALKKPLEEESKKSQ